MATLYLCTQKTKLRYIDNHFVLTTFDGGSGYGEELKRVNGCRVDNILVFGLIDITREALKHCFLSGIPVSYFSITGKYIGSSLSNKSKCSELKLCQYERYINPEQRLILAKTIVKGKIRNQLATIKHFTRNMDCIPADVIPVREQLNYFLNKVDNANSISAFDGIEGTCAGKYFSIFNSFLTDNLGFSQRVKHPATDPVNAMLSLGYTLVTNLINGIIIARGLEPAIGFLHELHSNRPSLACDLVEEFRAPVVDRFIVRACNLQMIESDMFEKGDDGNSVKFKESYFKDFLTKWQIFISKKIREPDVEEFRRQNLLGLIIRQVDRMARVLRAGGEYEPFKYQY